MKSVSYSNKTYKQNKSKKQKNTVQSVITATREAKCFGST